MCSKVYTFLQIVIVLLPLEHVISMRFRRTPLDSVFAGTYGTFSNIYKLGSHRQRHLINCAPILHRNRLIAFELDPDLRYCFRRFSVQESVQPTQLTLHQHKVKGCGLPFDQILSEIAPSLLNTILRNTYRATFPTPLCTCLRSLIIYTIFESLISRSREPPKPARAR